MAAAPVRRLGAELHTKTPSPFPFGEPSTGRYLGWLVKTSTSPSPLAPMPVPLLVMGLLLDSNEWPGPLLYQLR
jgi:hypothetical protein